MTLSEILARLKEYQRHAESAANDLTDPQRYEAAWRRLSAGVKLILDAQPTGATCAVCHEPTRGPKLCPKCEREAEGKRDGLEPVPRPAGITVSREAWLALIGRRNCAACLHEFPASDLRDLLGTGDVCPACFREYGPAPEATP